MTLAVCAGSSRTAVGSYGRYVNIIEGIQNENIKIVIIFMFYYWLFVYMLGLIDF